MLCSALSACSGYVSEPLLTKIPDQVKKAILAVIPKCKGWDKARGNAKQHISYRNRNSDPQSLNAKMFLVSSVVSDNYVVTGTITNKNIFDLWVSLVLLPCYP